MTIAYSGDNITFPDTTTQASAQVGMKNRVIDGGFILNQRVYVSGTSLASGVYGHDRWKGGASGGTYTFTQGALGVNTTITITAGSLIQVIEGCNVAEGGTYVLSWAGTAQGRLNGGSYGTSGTVTVTGWTAGTNLNVEFNTGTCGSVHLEKGSTATSFDYRPYGTELQLAQRYFQRWDYTAALGSAGATAFSATKYSTGDVIVANAALLCPMRTAPTITSSNSGARAVMSGGILTTTYNNLSANGNGAILIAATNNSISAGFGWIDQVGFLSASAEL